MKILLIWIISLLNHQGKKLYKKFILSMTLFESINRTNFTLENYFDKGNYQKFINLNN